jgi:hypothetical protein
MAATTKYGFVYKRHLYPGVETPATLEVIIKDSTTLVVGDAVQITSGYLDGCPVDEAMLGILVGVVTSKGENIFKSKEDHGATLTGDDTVAVAADNTTVHQVKGVVIVDNMALFLAYSDTALEAADLFTYFPGKANHGYCDGVADSGSGAWSVGTQQFQLVERVTTLEDGSASTTAGLFRIARSQILTDVTQATT